MVLESRRWMYGVQRRAGGKRVVNNKTSSKSEVLVHKVSLSVAFILKVKVFVLNQPAEDVNEYQTYYIVTFALVKFDSELRTRFHIFFETNTLLEIYTEEG